MSLLGSGYLLLFSLLAIVKEDTFKILAISDLVNIGSDVLFLAIF
jgi:hypothetical protein